MYKHLHVHARACTFLDVSSGKRESVRSILRAGPLMKCRG